MNLDALFQRIDSLTGQRVLISVFVIVGVLVAQRVIRRRLEQQDLDATLRLRWASQVRIAGLLVLFIALLFVWGSEIRDLVLSLVVLASALVVATKEVIMCLTGGLVRASSKSFAIGDRIEVGAHRGDVVDTRLLTTVLLESGLSHQRTGRRVVVPNSIFLSQPVANETFTQSYVLHTFVIPLRSGDNWKLLSAELGAIAEDVCRPHIIPANKRMEAVARQHSLPRFDVEPRVTVVLKEAHPSLQLRIPAPARERGRLEQLVIERFLERRDLSEGLGTSGASPSQPPSAPKEDQ